MLCPSHLSSGKEIERPFAFELGNKLNGGECSSIPSQQHGPGEMVSVSTTGKYYGRNIIYFHDIFLLIN